VFYIGGQFTAVSGQPRSNVAAVDALTAELRDWNPAPSDAVNAIAPTDTSVFLGGLFTSVDGQLRNFLAEVNTVEGAASSWDPSPDGQVLDIELANGLAYIGGSFGFVGALPRNNIAALDPVTGIATEWNPNPNGTIRSIELNCDKAYLGGFFTTIGGQSRNYVAAIDLATGSATGWNPNANGQLFDMEIADGVLYTGGLFTLIGGQARLRLAALDLGTGTATAWDPGCTGTVRALAAGGGQVFVGGSFTAAASTPISNLVSLTADATYGCPTVTITPATLPDGAAGTPYSQALSASGGTAPRCWAITEGSLPPGLALSSSGVISGAPTATLTSSFTVSTSDARGCTSSRTISLTTFGEPIAARIAPDASALCLNPAHLFVPVPIVYTRTDAAPVRLVSVTFHLDTSRIALRTPGTPAASVHLGSWFDANPNAMLQVVDLGGGTYTADATLLGDPCGPVTGGQLLNVDVVATGPDGFGALSVTNVHARDCSNAPVPVAAGGPDSVRIRFAPLAITPASLPGGLKGSSYHQELAADGGRAPYVFSLRSGSLPAGLTLSGAGVLEGVPTSTGVDTFTVGVADPFASEGLRAYSVTVNCAVAVIGPTELPDGLVGTPYNVIVTASGAPAPLSWTIESGTLPDGLTLAPATGEISGTPVAEGTGSFTIAYTDANGCGSSRACAFTIFAPPVAATLSADGAGLCLSTAHTRVAVPFVLSRTDAATVRHLRVRFQLDAAKLELATPAAPESSLHAGSWFAGFGSPTITATHDGTGAWTVDLAITGGPCGPAGGGQVLTADVVATGLDGAATIGVDRVKLLGCAGDTLPVIPGAATSLTINRTGPAALTDLVATAVTSGNGAGATTGITLAWTDGGQPVSLYRAPWAAYPSYTGSAPDSSLAPGAPWTLVASDVSSPYVDHPASRGYWYYVALVSDACGNLSPAPHPTSGTLNYMLGDVSDGATPGTGNNAVGLEDVTLLGAHYGISGATIASRGVGYLDVGPTTDLALTSRPAPDARLDFDDLMVFSANFQQSVAAPAGAAHATQLLAAIGAPERFQIDAPSFVTSGEEITVPLHLSAGGRMQGFSVKLAWDPAIVEPVGMLSGGFAEGQGGLLLSPGPGHADAALLGRRATGFTGVGLVTTFRFRALRSGDAALRIAEVLARDAANRPLATDAVADVNAVAAPGQTLLLKPAPNPFTASVALSFALARTGDADLAIFDLNGRLVRTLAHGRLEAGVHNFAWDGRDETRASVAPGVYYVRFATGGQRFTSRLVHLQ
jgi:hypothetical protein